MTETELEVIKEKAKKFDDIEKIVTHCYPENEENFDGDLCTIGEKIASYFGYI